MRSRLHIKLLLTLTALTLSACATPSVTAGDSTSTTPDLAHVHGLGVDPADGMLYAASHYGLFKLAPGGAPERVGPVQDVMGFTVVGPRHFLGSGHPGSRTDGPPHLGLVESTDAGQTWRELSLAGRADLHSIEAKHGLVYGYDSQSRQLMVTTDMRNWDNRARLAVSDFAVDPASPDVIVANTTDGLMRSSDGGRNFSLLPDAPELVFVEWPASGTLLGSDPNNTIYISADGGNTWARQGQAPGPPGAFAAPSVSDVYVGTETAIHYSSDGGRTFTIRQALT
ncbi:F510_1955 family glycosylhydrolase [Amycolatopsis tucumanensis]|nr:sialidase family protein [Amycolatopsis tucumanensis]MCF6427670.1 exo-alpha-sialidase [Amycolatopsis tucumanensis]